MIISKTNKNSYQIRLPSKIINIYNITEIQKITNKIVNKIKKEEELYGIAILEIYQDINYGTILEFKNIKENFLPKNEIEIKITIHTDNPFLYKLDYFDIIKDKKDKIYYYENNFYLKPNNKIKKRKYLDLLEKSEIIYQNTYQIINEGIRIKI